MIKTCYLLFVLCYTLSCFGQSPDNFYGVVLTQISHDDVAVDTSRLLYVRNTAGDRLSIYTVRDGLVSEATVYQLTTVKNKLFLYSRSPSDQLTKAALRVEFQDNTHTVVINKTDRYQLFPAYYARFKQELREKHAIMALLNLLSDGISDYPIADALPLLCYTPALGQQIFKAKIVTQRSQAAMQDTWTCHYYYNRQHQLDSVSAKSPEETRFYKKIRYSGSKVRSITTYLNIESRQETNRSISYDHSNQSLLKSKESVYEIGKNRETLSSVTLRRHDLGMLRQLEPSTAEVLKLLKPIKNNDDNTKKHID